MLIAITGSIAYLIIESIVFGVFALIISRKSKGDYNLAKAVLIIVILLEVQNLLIIPFFNLIDLRIGNAEIAKLIGTNKGSDLLGFSFSGLIFSLIQGILGFILGKKVLSKINI